MARNLAGNRYGRLIVIERANDYISPSGYKSVQWKCKCDCGNEVVVIGKSLTKKNNGTKSCGCLAKEVARETMYKTSKKYNTYDLSGEYGIGYTSKGEEFYFDLEDYDKIKDYCWHINEQGYVVTKDANRNLILMHRLIMFCPIDKVIDHRNGKETRNNNRKYNLRICTIQENGMNIAVRVDNTTGVTGVTWDKYENKWIARIGYKGQRIHLGYFNSFDDAVYARKKAEEKYFGEYAHI